MLSVKLPAGMATCSCWVCHKHGELLVVCERVTLVVVMMCHLVGCCMKLHQ